MNDFTALTPPLDSKQTLSCSGEGWATGYAGLLILAADGRIAHGNRDWFRLVEELQLTGANYQAGGDYLAACRSGWGRDIPEVRLFGERVSLIAQGGRQGPDIYCPYAVAGEQRWFRVSAMPLECFAEHAVLVMHNEVTDVVRHKEELTRQAFYDALTGLPNYALFGDRLHHAIAHSKRTGEPLATMFIDLDDFKLINDTYGHLSGNLVLSDVARRLSACLRECDTVGRLGGDEFGMILPGVGNREMASHVVEKVLTALSPFFLTHDEQNIQLTASIGVAFYPMAGHSPEMLMHGADQAMYLAKRSGRRGPVGSIFGVYPAATSDNGPASDST